MNEAIADLATSNEGTGKTQLIKLAAFTVATGALGFFGARRLVKDKEIEMTMLLANPNVTVIDV